MVNLVVVRGVCSAPVAVKELESGRRVARVSVRVPHDDGPAASVPLTIWQPASFVEDLAEGDEIVAVGTVRRRFYRTGAGSTGSVVEVEADYVGRPGRRRDLTAALRRAESALTKLDP